MRTIALAVFLAGSLLAQEPVEPQPETREIARIGVRFEVPTGDAALRPGLRVVNVDAGSPAQAAGLNATDVLIRINAAVIGSVDGVEERIRELAPGDRIAIAWFRRQQGAWTERSGHVTIPRPKPDVAVRETIGLEFAVVESKIRRRMIRTDSPYGFKISKVVDGSVASQLGLKRGNLLMEWDGKPVREVAELAKWIRARKPGDVVKIRVSRRKRGVSILSRKPWESVVLDWKVPAADGR